MIPSSRIPGRLALVLALLAILAPAARASEERQRVTQEGVVRPTGDIELTHEVRLPLRAYNTLKQQVKNTQMLLRRLGVQGQAAIYRDAQAAYDDEAHAIRVTALYVGGMRNAGETWWTPVANAGAQEVLDRSDRQITLLSIVHEEGAPEQVVTTRLHFPAGTTDVRWNAGRGRVECRLPPIPDEPGGHVDLDVALEVRPEIMSCLHKVYGLPDFDRLWIARAVFHNRGTATARDFRVRYRIVNHADWSPWQTSPRLQPGQTAVEVYHPIFDHRIRELTAETPSVLEAEWSYVGTDGVRVQGSDAQRITLLGMNHAVFSSHPPEEVVSWDELFDHVPVLAATFITHTDPIIQQFAGMAARVSRGAAAGVDDESALRFVHAIYRLMVHNRIAYQWPPGLFKRGVRQHVKYGRDVLRNRAGTCIDLSILFASTCEAGGLPAYLVVVPGHAFPAVRLPGGRLLPIESTGISIRKEGDALTFEQALEAGDRILRGAMEDGRYVLCDIQALRRAGVPPIELPTLPPGTLASWGITLPDDAAPTPETPPPPADLAVRMQRTPDGVAALGVPEGWTARSGPGQLQVVPGGFEGLVMLQWWPRRATSLEALAQVLESSGGGMRVTKRDTGTLAGLPCRVVVGSKDFDGTESRLLLVVLQTPHADLMLVALAAADAWDAHKQELAAVVDTLAVDPEVRPDAALEAPRDLREPAPPPPAPTLPLAAQEDAAGLYRLPVPQGWRVERVPGHLSVGSPDGNSLVDLTWFQRGELDHAAFVARARAHLAGSFTRWSQRSSETGTLHGHPVERVRADLEMTGTRGTAEVLLLSTDTMHWMLILACPPESREALAPTFTAITRGWTVHDPEALPALPMRTVQGAGGHYRIDLPGAWRVRRDGAGLVATAPDGDALVVCRVHDVGAGDFEAQADAVFARMRARASAFEVLDRESGERDGLPALGAEIADTVDGVAWVREVAMLRVDGQLLVAVIASRADAAWKWAGHLARIGASFAPRVR